MECVPGSRVCLITPPNEVLEGAHPSRLLRRMGSYALTPQTLFSSLLGLSCPCRARLLPARRRREAGRQLHPAHHLPRPPHNCHPDPAGRDPTFSSAPLSGASGLSPSCHPDRSNGAFCRCAVEGSWHDFNFPQAAVSMLRHAERSPRSAVRFCIARLLCDESLFSSSANSVSSAPSA